MIRNAATRGVWRLAALAITLAAWLPTTTALAQGGKRGAPPPPAEPSYGFAYFLVLICIALAFSFIARPHRRARQEQSED